MPGTRHVVLIVLLAWMSATTCVASACPYCPRTDDLTLCEKLADSDAACVVKFLESRNGEELSMQETTFLIVQVMKRADKFQVDGKIVTAFGVTANSGDTFLLMGKKDTEGEMEWSLPIEIDEISREYVRQAPSHEVMSEPQRLIYFLKFLDFANPVISNDAFLEFAKASFEDVNALVRQLKASGKESGLRSKLRKWLDDENQQLDVRRAFYGMLLGLCGTDDDASFLEEKLMAPIDPQRIRPWIGGMMAGYLMLRGEDGLRFLVEKKIEGLSVDESDNDLDSMRSTLVFLWDFRRNQFSEESLRVAMRKFLDRPEFAETAIRDLARWKDWVPLGKLTQSYGRDPWETRSAKEKIVAYALICLKDVPTSSGNRMPEHAIEAKKFLDQLDPAFVQAVKQSLFFVPKNPVK